MIKGILQIGNKLKIKRIGLGTMRLTSGEGKWGMPKDKNNAIKVLRDAVDLGVNFFDTADMYGPNISENIISEALFPYRDDIIIATKGGNTILGPNKVIPDCSPKHIKKAIEQSLKRLKLDCIDLYQLHTVDPKIDIEFSMEALAEAKSEGKIRHIGVSNIDLQNLIRAQKIENINTIQNRYNIDDTTSEEIILYARKHNIVFISYYPLAKGKFS